jgi:dTDP-4-amino-4,6-dideoxygalactose transaminase
MKKETKNIYVTKSFLPPIKEYRKFLDKIWDSNQLTNQGPLVQELEMKLKKYLEVKNLHFVANGTVALQLALNALNISKGEIITTPFSYVATVSSVLWEGCSPVFVDIETNTFSIDAEKIEEAITKNTKAIMAVHVFGFPCNVEKIARIAQKHNLKVIYDGAHAFGVKYKGKSLLDHGDISICSFHATKLFHTVEGGACIARDKDISDKLELAKRFGHNGDEHYQSGINAKNSELHAAMGLCNLKYINEIFKDRKRVCDLYDELLEVKLGRPALQKGLEYNYSYYPVIFESEKQLLTVFEALKKKNIYPRRYFYPSLNTLPYMKNRQSCPISEDISKRIACLPLFVGLKKESIKKITNIIKDNI